MAAFVSAAFGTITLVPAFIEFPLVGTLVHAGVSVVPSVAFLTTLTIYAHLDYSLKLSSTEALLAGLHMGEYKPEQYQSQEISLVR